MFKRKKDIMRKNTKKIMSTKLSLMNSGIRIILTEEEEKQAHL